MKQIYSWLSLFTLLFITSCTPEMQGELEEMIHEAKNTYYISPDGNDSNSGNSPDDAWKTIDKVNQMDFQPGSKILFEGGKSFAGNLYFTVGDGNDASNPIKVTSYGTGRATIKAGDKDGIYVYNTAGIIIDNLIFSGSGMYSNNASGINFYNDLPGNVKLNRVDITNTEVFGFRNFGIVIGAYNGNSGFSNVLIENNKVHDILDVGISSYGAFSSTKTGYAHSNITVRNCEVYNIPGYSKKSHSGNGIVISDVQKSVIEYSTVYDCGKGNTNCGGPVGIWYWDADQVTIQHNEAYNISSGTGCDGGGFDLDGGVTNGIMQYNYSHDNDGAGYLVGQFTGARAMNNIIVRYNISENDAATNGGSVYLFNGAQNMDNIFVYNNTFYISEQAGNRSSAAIKLLQWKLIKGNIQFNNNILYALNGADLVSVPSGYSASFKGNLYYSPDNFNIAYHGTSYASLESFRNTGNEKLNTLNTGFQGDPNLNSPGAGTIIGHGKDLTGLSSYKLAAGSPAKDMGINLDGGIGERDYYGNAPVKNSQQDIGAHEL
ncbi:right-handed parallel beta-helix repeat-containing protein [Antarcticibacterium arcticum]|uniref:Right-handed parallel beta-helix repeat-containing protein n=1 Tax=Antarcticibacterium arcticum TaxID=2585771 RepID=A0A5B8YK26_9FLAO|nr:right-handed parallel beta-helix repeat-containing protein [Antarcticibacterium arcticum]QED38005.1 right-handed parallel beta-helix repeat-containing protein [Antarcticibacterium arcticum]